GRFNEAIGHLHDLQRNLSGQGEAGSVLELAAAIARLRLADGDSGAPSEIDSVLVEHPLTSMDVYSRPYFALARFYAAANQPRRAELLVTAYEREYPAQFRGPNRWLLLLTRASVAEAEGNIQQAIKDLRDAGHVPPIRLGLFDERQLKAVDHPE